MLSSMRVQAHTRQVCTLHMCICTHVGPAHTGPPRHDLFSTLQPGLTPGGSLPPPLIPLRVKAKALFRDSQAPWGLCPPWSRAGPLMPLSSLSAFVPALPGLECSSFRSSPPQILTTSISRAPLAPTWTSLPSAHHLPASFTYSLLLLAFLTRMYTG